ncbi:GGDEF domain-containing protein [Aliikangiella sp. G2MR2-5]|uniref:GGDEF domain-containing protein n=1 Tax=Aliikangiella sp. G2MR2-5 TaxID=2788943 RepID=UPI0018AC4874
MNEEILNSVIKITKNSDVDSLELSLVKTLVEFLNCSRVSIYKDLKFFNSNGIEESLHLSIDSDNKYHWREREVNQSLDNELVSCMSSNCPITVEDPRGFDKRWFPISLNDETIGVIYMELPKLDPGQQVLVNAFCRIYENYLIVLNLSERDKLTGLLNRQTFEQKLSGLLRKQVRNQYNPADSAICKNDQRGHHIDSFSWLAVVDVDHFKRVNDKFGHVCGDEVLLILSQSMQSFFRRSDLLFRFGGEEFVIVLEPTTLEMAKSKLDFFRRKVEAQRFPLVGRITISIGLSKMSPHDYPMNVFEQADKALYFAKNTGRNKLASYEELIDEGHLTTELEQSEVDLF